MAQELINGFEEEQRSLVFSSLTDFFNLSLYTDVTLLCKNQQHLKAHKIVLSSSSKFFRDLFKHNPNISLVDLDKELAHNDLSLPFEDVQLIVGILYCVGTVDIWPQRIQSLLVSSQILGIPSLSRFLRKISEHYNLSHQHHQQPVSSEETISGKFLHNSSSTSNPEEYQLICPQSQATITSLENFGLHQFPSPSLSSTRDQNAITNSNSNQNTNVLEGLDPSFLNHLPANQIDDLENALLPHLHAQEVRQNDSNSLEDAGLDDDVDDCPRDENLSENAHSNTELSPEKTTQDQATVKFNKLLPDSNDDLTAIPVVLHPEHSPKPIPHRTVNDFIEDSKMKSKSQNDLPTNPQLQGNKPIIEGGEEDSSEEVKVNLDSVDGSKSLKFAIPGSSKSVTLNFSADALMEMRNSVKNKMSYRLKRKNKIRQLKKGRILCNKNIFNCHICAKKFKSKSLLDKHLSYHVDLGVNCQVCKMVFSKKWALEQHMAVQHSAGDDKTFKCEECDKEFKWARNLLAHHQLHHTEEKRYRCKFCPLTFLKRKSYVNHQTSKHADRPVTWCKDCLEIFESGKRKEDHECSLMENTGSTLKCHRHEKTLEFHTENEMIEHLKLHSDDENVILAQKFSCPVCHKRFLMKKNLNSHIKRFHDNEEKNQQFKCNFCDKTFFFKKDKDSHENTHKPTTSFGCRCGKSYSSKKALVRHQKISHTETNETNKCHICEKILSDKYKLKYHMSVHSEKRSFQCSECKSTFKARENLIRHMSRTHKKRENTS